MQGPHKIDLATEFGSLEAERHPVLVGRSAVVLIAPGSQSRDLAAPLAPERLQEKRLAGNDQAAEAALLQSARNQVLAQDLARCHVAGAVVAVVSVVPVGGGGSTAK